ncbi:MAG: undecaprenyl diphosphate synthase family protein [Nanoarchaeota archaeon]
MVLDSLLPLKRLKEIDENGQKIKHIAFNLSDISQLEKIMKEKGDTAVNEIENNLSMRNKLLRSLFDLQLKNNIPIMTLYVSKKIDKPIFFSKIYEKLNEFLDFILPVARENQTRITFLGKWYDVPGNSTEKIRRIASETKSYESYFLNLCINYDGQEEILDSCKIIAHKVKLGQIEPNSISMDNLKDNIYISRFSPPDRIISISRSRKLYSFLLWDSAYSYIYFHEKDWSETVTRDLERFFVS